MKWRGGRREVVVATAVGPCELGDCSSVLEREVCRSVSMMLLPMVAGGGERGGQRSRELPVTKAHVRRDGSVRLVDIR